MTLMRAVDVVAKRPDVDSTRMGVTGGSYGGFMTAWVTTKTNRFKAAETDRMISEWTYWYGASDAQGLTEGEFFGHPWENQIMYDTLSPIRHVKKVKTPTLLVQSEEDFRTPIGNAELWFRRSRSRACRRSSCAIRARTTICRAPASRGCSSTVWAGCASGSGTGSVDKPAATAAATTSQR